MGKVASVENIIGKVDIWNAAEVRYEPLSGGITNHNYLCRVENKKYVLRIPGAGTDTLTRNVLESLMGLELPDCHC